MALPELKKRNLLKIWGPIVCGLIVALPLAVLYLSSPKTQYQYVQGTELIPPKIINIPVPLPSASDSETEWKEQRKAKRGNCVDLLQKNHLIQPASGITLIIDHHTPGKPTAIDDEGFNRLSVSIEHPEINRTYDASYNELQIYYSIGSEGWVMQCAGYYANEADGTVILTKMSNNKITAQLNLYGTAVHASRSVKENFSFVGEYTFSITDSNIIRQWAGKWDDFI